MDIPTEADWQDWPPGVNRPMDLDEAYTRRRFAGKSVAEALELFRSTCVLSCSEDVSYMPPVPFRYYMLAFRAHVLAEVEGDVQAEASDAASSFLSLVERKLEVEIASIAPIMNDLLPAVEFVAMNQERYDAPQEIYGSFREHAGRIKALWVASQGSEGRT